MSYLTNAQENRLKIQNEENEKIQQAQLIFWEARKRKKLKKVINSRKAQNRQIISQSKGTKSKSKAYFETKQYGKMREEILQERKIKLKERSVKDSLISMRSIPGLEVYNKTAGMNKSVKLNLE